MVCCLAEGLYAVYLSFVLLAPFSSLLCPGRLTQIDCFNGFHCSITSGWVHPMVGTGRRLGWEESDIVGCSPSQETKGWLSSRQLSCC